MKIQDLSISERIVLAEALWDSIPTESTTIELSAEQKFELDIRLQAFLDDQNNGSSWSEVKCRITGNA